MVTPILQWVHNLLIQSYIHPRITQIYDWDQSSGWSSRRFYQVNWTLSAEILSFVWESVDINLLPFLHFLKIKTIHDWMSLPLINTRLWITLGTEDDLGRNLRCDAIHCHYRKLHSSVDCSRWVWLHKSQWQSFNTKLWTFMGCCGKEFFNTDGILIAKPIDGILHRLSYTQVNFLENKKKTIIPKPLNSDGFLPRNILYFRFLYFRFLYMRKP